MYTNIHFILKFFSHLEDLKQQHHLPRVLQGFGIPFRQQALEPNFLKTLRARAAGFCLTYTQYNTGRTRSVCKMRGCGISDI